MLYPLQPPVQRQSPIFSGVAVTLTSRGNRSALVPPWAARPVTDDSVEPHIMSEAEIAASRVNEAKVMARVEAMQELLRRIRGLYIGHAILYESWVEDIIAHHFAPDRVGFFKSVVFEDMTMSPKIRMLKRVMQDLGIEGEFKRLRKGLDDCMQFAMLGSWSDQLHGRGAAATGAVTIVVYDDGGEREIVLTEATLQERILSTAFHRGRNLRSLERRHGDPLRNLIEADGDRSDPRGRTREKREYL